MTSDYLAKLEAMAARASGANPKPSPKKDMTKPQIYAMGGRVISAPTPRIEVHVSVPYDDMTVLTSERILDKPAEIPASRKPALPAADFPKDLMRLGFAPSSYQYFLDDGDMDILSCLLDDTDVPSAYPKMNSATASIQTSIRDVFSEGPMEAVLSKFINGYLEPCLHVGLTPNNPFELTPCIMRIPIIIANTARGSVYYHDFVLYAPHNMLYIVCNNMGTYEFSDGIRVQWGITNQKASALAGVSENELHNSIRYSLSLQHLRMAQLGVCPVDTDHDIVEVTTDFCTQLTNLILRDLQNDTK